MRCGHADDLPRTWASYSSSEVKRSPVPPVYRIRTPGAPKLVPTSRPSFLGWFGQISLPTGLVHIRFAICPGSTKDRVFHVGEKRFWDRGGRRPRRSSRPPARLWSTSARRPGCRRRSGCRSPALPSTDHRGRRRRGLLVPARRNRLTADIRRRSVTRSEAPAGVGFRCGCRAPPPASEGMLS